jgi:hypothetical protein
VLLMELVDAGGHCGERIVERIAQDRNAQPD